MLTDGFYVALAAALRETGGAARFFIAVGSGDPGWDAAPPAGDRAADDLVREVARAAVEGERVEFLDERGDPSDVPTHRLRLSVTFGDREAVGTLREAGLFGPGPRDGRPVLLSHVVHPRVEKAEGATLSRAFRIDLAPQPVLPGSRETRYLGNTSKTELHDLENRQSRCQIDQIRFDRRYYFDTIEQATAAGYDYCAYCFGRDLSTR
jgi:hypothetical protein